MKQDLLQQSERLAKQKMASAPNVRGLESYMGLEVGLLAGTSGVGKLVGKEGESSEAGGEHAALLTRMQSLVPTQR